MRIAVISDLHLGRGDRVDLFGHSHGVFVRFLRFLERNFERIVLLGDVFEVLAARPKQRKEELEIIRGVHNPVLKRFARPEYTMVYGNHDAILARAGIPDELVLEEDGVRLLFRHGHTFDWSARNTTKEFFVWLGFLLARWGLRFFYRVGELLDSWFRELGAFRRWALEMAHRREADVIVTAHTHRGGHAEEDGRVFLNSGACSKGRFSWLALDTKAGTYRHLESW